MDETKICRFCLNNDTVTEYLNIFTSLPVGFIQKIQNCLSIQVVENDGLPIFACSYCVEKINHFDAFKKSCCNSYEFLRGSKHTVYGNKFDIKTEVVKGDEISATQTNIQ
ncbi:hypothetical protein Trydic_g6403 [Trypoxylus dichotomus]